VRSFDFRYARVGGEAENFPRCPRWWQSLEPGNGTIRHSIATVSFDLTHACDRKGE
jgi:hypothetical protein